MGSWKDIGGVVVWHRMGNLGGEVAPMAAKDNRDRGNNGKKVYKNKEKKLPKQRQGRYIR